MNLLKGSYQDELDYFFRTLNGNETHERIVSKQAFSSARKKVKSDAFVELNQDAIRFFENNYNPDKWHGFSLLAVDGSTEKVPKTKEVAEHFGELKSNQGDNCPLARISQMYDVLNDITIDAIICPHSEGERELASLHFINLMPHDLVLLDRGYPAYWVFNLILNQDAQFCARISKKWLVIREFIESGEIEQTISLEAPPSSFQKCRELGLDTKALKLRLIRVELDTGEPEVLITSLNDNEKYPVEIFGDLYHHRWPVEEDYKVMKKRIEIGRWSGKSVLSVYQDFHAKVFTKNLTAILSYSAQKQIEKQVHERKYNYQINFTQALSKMKDTVVLLFNRPRDAVMRILDKLHVIFTKTIEPIRPGRKFPRKHKIPQQFYICYKPIR